MTHWFSVVIRPIDAAKCDLVDLVKVHYDAVLPNSKHEDSPAILYNYCNSF